MKTALISSFVAILLLTGCEQKIEQNNTNEVAPVEKTEEKPVQEDDLINKIKNTSENITAKVGEASKQIKEIINKTSKEVGEEASIVTEEVVKKGSEVTKEVQKEVEKSADKIEKSINNIIKSSNSTKGEQLFLKCAGCHGQKGELKALGKSEIIQGWDKQRTIDALNGYKNDTYGKAMKGVMKSQVLSLSDSDIEAMAEYISTL
ncbi:hypothetical protein CP960_12205 [Malaciobacter halophilus]|uniref:Cytochrome c domain-containing protein n=1 Tax=Malaciobacter halophilus TaxID=197482 RepID=A0A2N1J025_9BACT|nr:c-type cytochrome [Malaciobacter halophilus]AXH10460.1 cytochrome c [Malaciobacter halophilus]PKI79892.1 hypothetical protein CP960_12205 [Malaciobacter halophilus]